MGVEPKIVEKNPKWMVYNGKPYEQMGWFGGKTPYFWVQHPIWIWVILSIHSSKFTANKYIHGSIPRRWIDPWTGRRPNVCWMIVVQPPQNKWAKKKACSKPCPPVQVLPISHAVLVSLCFLYLCLCSSVVGIVPSVQRDFLGGGDLISKNDGKTHKS